MKKTIHKKKLVVKKSQPGVKASVKTNKRKRCSHEGCTNQVVMGGVCVTHGSKDLNKSPKVQPNAYVTPSVPSCQSINYEDED